MTNEELFKLHDDLCREARNIMARKNQDYRGGDTSDPFANFKGSTAFGVAPEVGTMIRMQDKFMRIKSFIENGTLAVQDEALLDIGHDLINYSVLLIGQAMDRQIETALDHFEGKGQNDDDDISVEHTAVAVPDGYRVLARHERVRKGDFVYNELQQEFVPVISATVLGMAAGDSSFSFIRCILGGTSDPRN